MDLFFIPEVDAKLSANYQLEIEPTTMSVAESILKKAASNFELEVTSTLVMTLDEPLLQQNWSSQYAYHYHLLIARGASFCQ
jgi:hypothetical protein